MGFFCSNSQLFVLLSCMVLCFVIEMSIVNVLQRLRGNLECESCNSIIAVALCLCVCFFFCSVVPMVWYLEYELMRGISCL